LAREIEITDAHLLWSHGRTENRCALFLADAPVARETQMKKILLITMLSLLAASCGVKNELAKPDGTTTPKSQNDPSRPPYPIGR
jgi:hypothetical protein